MRVGQCSNRTWGTSGYDRIWQWRLTPALAPVFLSREEKEEGKEGVCIARRSAQRRFSFLRRPTDRPTSVTGRRRLERGREKEREGKRELVTLVRPGGGGGAGGESREGGREGKGTRFVCAAAVGTFPVASHHAPTSHGTVGRWLQCKQFILRLRETFSSDRLRERSRSHLLAFPHGVVSVLSISARPAVAPAAGE